MKWFKRIVIVVLLLIVVGVIVLILRIDSIVRGAVESQGTAQTKLQTTLDAATMSLLHGKLTLNNLQIASPEGYSAPKMVMLGSGEVVISYGQLTGDPKHITSVSLDKPVIIMENRNGKFNFKKVMDDMPPSDPSSKPMKLIIDDLSITNATVLLRPGISGIAQEIKIDVPEIHLKNVGGDSGGAEFKEVLMQVITVVASSVKDSDKMPGSLKGLFKADLSGTIGGLSASAQKVLGDSLGKGIGDLSKQGGAALQNLFGGPPKH